MFGGGFTRFGSTTPVVKNLIIINVLAFLLTYLTTRYQGFLISNFALFYFESPFFRVHQFVTHMFMHGGIAHIFFNMFALWMFGKVLESVWGSKRFLFYYMVTGIGAAAFYTLVNYFSYSSIEAAIQAFQNTPSPDVFETILNKYFSGPNAQESTLIGSWVSDINNPMYVKNASAILVDKYFGLINIPTLGASGAVFGILLAFGMLFPNTELMLLFPPIPIKAKWFVLGYGAIELYLGMTQRDSNIAHFAHLGGMLFGFILIKYWNSRRTNFY